VGGDKCRYKCSQKILDEARKSIFSSFYSPPSCAQDVYLFGCIRSQPPRLSLNTASYHRDVAVSYMVSTGTEKVRVSKVAFQCLHDCIGSNLCSPAVRYCMVAGQCSAVSQPVMPYTCVVYVGMAYAS